MATSRTPGPQHHNGCSGQIDDGTTCRQASPLPGSIGTNTGTPGAVSRMSLQEKLAEAIRRTSHFVPPEIAGKLMSLLTPQAIAIIAGTTALWAGGHFFGVSEVVDVALLAVGVYALGSESIMAGNEFKEFVTVAVRANSYSELDSAAQHLARFISIVGVDTAIAVLLHKAGRSAEDTGAVPKFVNLTPELRVELRPDFPPLRGGRSGEDVPFLTGPPNSAIKGSGTTNRVFVTNSAGQVILEIDVDRVKEIIPGKGFDYSKRPGFSKEKRTALTPEEKNLIEQMWK